MERPKIRPSTYSWAGLVAGVYLYDKYCPPGEMLSQRADQWIEHPIKSKAFIAAIGLVGLHLCNKIPERYDPISHLLPPKEVA